VVEMLFIEVAGNLATENAADPEICLLFFENRNNNQVVIYNPEY
jgi:hypothetical protein